MVWIAILLALAGSTLCGLYFLYRLLLGAPFEDSSGLRGSLMRRRPEQESATRNSMRDA